MIDYIQEQRVDEADWHRPFGDPEVDFAPVRRRPWPEATHPALDAMAPGAELASWVSSVDPRKLSGSDRISLIRAHQRLVSHYQARIYRDMMAITDLFREEMGIEDPDDGAFATEAEVRAALAWTRRYAQMEVHLAISLHDRYPEVLAALECGDIDVARARAIVRGTELLDEGTATRIASAILDDAPRLTTGEIRARLRDLADAADRDAAARRFDEAYDRRRVILDATVDGTAHVLGMDISPSDAAAAAKRINRLARRARTEGDERSPDQVKADVFVDLLLGRSAGTTATADGRSRTADLDIRVDLTTLMELDDTGADIAGYGPVIAEIARDVVRSRDRGQWTYTVTDPRSGRPLTTGPIRRRPTAAQRRAVRSRQPTCVFPGCRAPAGDADLDHTRPWASGGETSEENLAPLCRHDHRVKGEGNWTYACEDDGAVVWTSPLGRTYRREPPRPPPRG